MPKSAHLQDELQDRTQKSILLSACVAFFFVILILRVFFLQVIQAEINIRLSKENQMQVKIIKAPRGIIYDRNGVVLARNRPSYSIGILPYKMNKRVPVVSNLLKIRDKQGEPIFDSLSLVARIKKAYGRRFDVTRLKEDVSIDIVSIIEEHTIELPGVLVQTEARREYPLGPVTFHVLGYMSEIQEALFDSLKQCGYQYGDNIGQAGIEKQYESLLRGKDGMEYVEVNAYGRSLGPIEQIPRVLPDPGKNIYLTIDAGVQKSIAENFPDTLKGAVVAVNPKNGEVLAMFSNPAVDPNIFSLATSLRSQSWAEAARDQSLPLNNRATTGTYPPGSTFKLVSALAGIASGKINPNAYMPRTCTGAYRIGNRLAHCWNLKGHGALKMKDAVKVSCNIYFYQLGLKVGDKIINSYAEKLGLGECTGIDLPNERPGWLSGEVAYNKRFAKRGWKWTQGLVLDLAIGQAQLVTPLQMAVMVGGLGNGKKVYRPFLLKEVRGEDGAVVWQKQPQVMNELSLSDDVLEKLHSSMEEVITGSGGTGRRSQVTGIRVGGKSGSAQNPHGDLTHGLFIACAPLEDPVIAVGAVVENAGHGGTVAAPITGAALNYFFLETEDGKRTVELYSTEKPKDVTQHATTEQ